MTEANKTPSSTSKKPPYIAYSVRERGEGKDSKWTEIGVAFPHKDGKGFQLKYNACPIGDCEIVLRLVQPKSRVAQ